MRVWLISFLLLFGSAELFQWIRHMSLPMPIFILGGAFLAIASNYDKLSNLPFHLDYQKPNPSDKEIAAEPIKKVVSGVSGKPQQSRSISFDIRKPFKPKD